MFAERLAGDQNRRTSTNRHTIPGMTRYSASEHIGLEDA